jgi:sarcosine oxidase subunit beta
MKGSEVAEVIVIGGGVIGLSVAGELRRAGAGRVVVLEREGAVGQASSSRANGGVRAQFTTTINIEFSKYSIARFEEMDRSMPQVAFHQTGYLLMAGTQEGAAQLEEAGKLQRSLGVDTVPLSAEEVSLRAPVVSTSGLAGANFHARDGFIDPHGVVSAMKELAQREGAEIVVGTEVRGIDPGSEARFAIDTTRGTFESRWIVNAAGSDAGEIAALAGVEVPVDPVRRNLAFAHDTGGELIPMCVDLDTGVLVRREVGGGFVIAYSDPADPPGWDKNFDPKFLNDVSERIGHRFPQLEDLTIDPRHCWAGLYPETPDHHAIVGEAELPGFVICGGFGGHGIMHSPAAGKAVAELIVEGGCTTFDLHPLRPGRFSEGDLVVETAVL